MSNSPEDLWVKTPPVVNVRIPLSQVERVFEALDKASHDHDLSGGVREQQDFFAQQNPATKKMAETVRETYDAMVSSLAKEVAEVLE